MDIEQYALINGMSVVGMYRLRGKDIVSPFNVESVRMCIVHMLGIF